MFVPFFSPFPIFTKFQEDEIINIDPIFYDNPENLSQEEIDLKICTLCPWRGPNSQKRIETLESYSSSTTSKEEWIEKYTSKF